MRSKNKNSPSKDAVVKLDVFFDLDSDFNLAYGEEKCIDITLAKDVNYPPSPIPPSPGTYRTFNTFQKGLQIKPFNFNIQDDPILAKVIIKNTIKDSIFITNNFKLHEIYARPIKGNNPITKNQPLENQDYSIPAKNELECKSAKSIPIDSPQNVVNELETPSKTPIPDQDYSIPAENNPIEAPQNVVNELETPSKTPIPDQDYSIPAENNPIETPHNSSIEFTPHVPKTVKIECKNAATIFNSTELPFNMENESETPSKNEQTTESEDIRKYLYIAFSAFAVIVLAKIYSKY